MKKKQQLLILTLLIIMRIILIIMIIIITIIIIIIIMGLRWKKALRCRSWTAVTCRKRSVVGCLGGGEGGRKG